MARIKYYDSTSGEWKYGDSVGSSAQYVIYDPDGSYSNGTVGKELKTHSSQKADKTELIPLNATMASTHALSTAEEQYVSDNVVKKSNPNLLDNPWFTVNQRGQETYTSAGYTVDRWKQPYGIFHTTVSENGVTIENTSGSHDEFYQFIEHNKSEELLGKDVVFSAMKQDGSIETLTVSVPNSFPSSTGIIRRKQFGNCEMAFAYFAEAGCFAVIFNIDTVTTLQLRAAKLEFGNISTLKNDSAPDYAIELVKCQRYYLNSDLNDVISNGFITNSSRYLYFDIILPGSMRINPTLEYHNVSGLRTVNGTNISVTETGAASVKYNGGNRARMDVEISAPSGVTNNTPISAYCRYILNADL